MLAQHWVIEMIIIEIRDDRYARAKRSDSLQEHLLAECLKFAVGAEWQELANHDHIRSRNLAPAPTARIDQGDPMTH